MTAPPTVDADGNPALTDTRTRLIADLRRVEDDDYRLRPGERVADFLPSMLTHIGDTDAPRSRAQVVARVNTKNFLRSLHFRRPRAGLLADAVLAAEGRVNRFQTA